MTSVIAMASGIDAWDESGMTLGLPSAPHSSLMALWTSVLATQMGVGWGGVNLEVKGQKGVARWSRGQGQGEECDLKVLPQGLHSYWSILHRLSQSLHISTSLTLSGGLCCTTRRSYGNLLVTQYNHSSQKRLPSSLSPRKATAVVDGGAFSTLDSKP